MSAYRKTKHQTQKQTARKKPAASRSPIKRKTGTKKVEPVARTKTVRLSSEAHSPSDVVVPITYSRDTSTLVPVLGAPAAMPTKALKKATVTIATRSTKMVPVTSAKQKETNFSSEKLPEISLSGKLLVSETTVAQPAQDVSEMSGPDLSSELKPTKTKSEEVKESNNLTEDTKSSKKSVVQQPATQKQNQFTPSTVTSQQKKLLGPVVRVSIGATFAASVVALLLIGFGSEIVVEGTEYQNRLQFNLANLQEVANIFK